MSSINNLRAMKILITNFFFKKWKLNKKFNKVKIIKKVVKSYQKVS